MQRIKYVEIGEECPFEKFCSQITVNYTFCDFCDKDCKLRYKLKITVEVV